MSEHIVVLGNSVAGVKAAEEIRQKNKDAEITLVPFDGYWPARRDRFPDYLAGRISLEDVAYQPESFYQQHNIRFLPDLKITRINFKQQKIYAEDRQQVNFDKLIVTELPQQRFPDIRGVNKTGVFGCHRIADIESIKKEIPYVDAISIESDRLNGLQLALACVAEYKKEVYLISSGEEDFWSLLSDEVIEGITGYLSGRHIHFMRGCYIQEVLGDGEVKAVRLSSNKVVASNMVVFENTKPDLRVISDTERVADGKIPVTENYQVAGFEAVFAADMALPLNSTVAYHSISACAQENQGRIVAAAILKEQVALAGENLSAAAQADQFDFSVLGELCADNGANESFVSGEGAFSYIKLFIRNQRLCGAIVINNPAKKEKCGEVIKSEQTLENPDELVQDNEQNTSAGPSAVTEDEKASEVSEAAQET